MVDPSSLSRTVDALNAALFERRRPSAREREASALWIAARQGLPGAYAGTFAGFPAERQNGALSRL